MPAKPAISHQSTTVYARTGKGVLAFKNRTAKVSDELEHLFSCIDGKATVADVGAEAEMAGKELDQALDALEDKGYIKVFRQGVDQNVADFTEAPDLDFTGSLLEVSVREATRARAQAEQSAVEPPAAPAQGPPDTTAAPAEEPPQANTEAVAQRVALEARIQELEAESQAVKRTRNDAIKALAQAKSLAAEARTRAEELARKLAEAEARQPGPEVATGSMQAPLAQAQEAVAHLEMQLTTERETREQMVQALREAQSAAEAGRNAAEMRLKETQIALQQAEKVDRQNLERLRQVEAQVETGRRARADAEAALAALQAELTDAKAESERASAAARQQAERTAQVELEIDTERKARAEAEANASAEREGREKAMQALLEIKRVLGTLE